MSAFSSKQFKICFPCIRIFDIRWFTNHPVCTHFLVFYVEIFAKHLNMMDQFTKNNRWIIIFRHRSKQRKKPILRPIERSLYRCVASPFSFLQKIRFASPFVRAKQPFQKMADKLSLKLFFKLRFYPIRWSKIKMQELSFRFQGRVFRG